MKWHHIEQYSSSAKGIDHRGLNYPRPSWPRVVIKKKTAFPHQYEIAHLPQGSTTLEEETMDDQAAGVGVANTLAVVNKMGNAW